jgi:hypothetical protein
MKEDYLWDKTGKDIEIEQLENTLQTFKYRATAPPILPRHLKKVEKTTPNFFFASFRWRFVFALANCLLVGALVAFGIWFQRSETTPNMVAVANINPQTVDIQPSQTKQIDLPENNPKFVETRFTVPQKTVKAQFIKIQKSSPVVVPGHKIAVPKAAKIKPTEQLTKEEFYAYTQLMTALSITSSKLKLVRDKVEGIEN